MFFISRMFNGIIKTFNFQISNAQNRGLKHGINNIEYLYNI